MGADVCGCLGRGGEGEKGEGVIMRGDFRGYLGKGEEQGGSYNRRGRLGVFKDKGRVGRKVMIGGDIWRCLGKRRRAEREL